MNVTISRFSPQGTVFAIASKSAAHRQLICAALADAPTRIRCEQTNRDIDATAECLRAMGAIIRRDPPYFFVEPIRTLRQMPTLPCGESGSTLRFLLPVVAALGCGGYFVMEGRLPLRPLSPLYEELCRCGITLSPQGENPLRCTGKLTGGDFSLAGNISSQFISGTLFALSCRPEGGRLSVTGKTESQPYIDMTLDALAAFGCAPEREGNAYRIPPQSTLPRLFTPGSLSVEGDWSNAAFPLCAGALGGSVTVSRLSFDGSRQGDREILSLLRRFGAKVVQNGDSITVSHAPLHGTEIDATQIPDLVPVLATVAAVAEGKTVITGASRLRLKESDRLCTTRDMLRALGADIRDTEDGLEILGKPALTGGVTSSFGDHRIAMSAAVAAVVCHSPVKITDAQACEKSYPGFWDDMESLGAVCQKQ